MDRARKEKDMKIYQLNLKLEKEKKKLKSGLSVSRS
jgi:hypothetical protein